MTLQHTSGLSSKSKSVFDLFLSSSWLLALQQFLMLSDAMRRWEQGLHDLQRCLQAQDWLVSWLYGLTKHEFIMSNKCWSYQWFPSKGLDWLHSPACILNMFYMSSLEDIFQDFLCSFSLSLHPTCPLITPLLSYYLPTYSIPLLYNPLVLPQTCPLSPIQFPLNSRNI